MDGLRITAAGRGLLDRRRFLERAASGLGGIALASLLAERRSLADASPIRPAGPCLIEHGGSERTKTWP